MIARKEITKLVKSALRVALIKGNYNENNFENVAIYSDGSIGVMFESGGCGYESELFPVNFSDLEKSDEELKREAEVELKKKRAEELKEKEKAEEEQRRKEYKNYLKLKEKFENNKKAFGGVKDE